MINPVHKSVVIIGGGPAGLAAACALHKNGVKDILVIERENDLGGILRQCIHDGFGLTRFKKSLSGPEYAQLFIDEADALVGIDCITRATVVDISPDRVVTAATSGGLLQFSADAIVLAMGCRERTRGALSIPGDRPSGVYTAGVAQAYINLKNTMVGKNAVILGSGDIGMIMARRLTLEGARVLGVYEVLPYPSGLPRNVEQCLRDYDIPLHLSHTVTNILGNGRLRAVEVSRVDSGRQPIPGTQTLVNCDTLVLSVGLIPENELSLKAGVQLDKRTNGAIVDERYMTNVPGIFAAGNVLHVHDLVDFVSLEAERLAGHVAAYLKSDAGGCDIQIRAGEGISYTVPQKISGTSDALLSFRVKSPLRPAVIELWQDGACIQNMHTRKSIPAEMERITVQPESLQSKNPIEVRAKNA